MLNLDALPSNITSVVLESEPGIKIREPCILFIKFIGSLFKLAVMANLFEG